eukprot:scaffold624_cov402-Prasinococcus_capsulatus_cf.AAC.53
MEERMGSSAFQAGNGARILAPSELRDCLGQRSPCVCGLIRFAHHSFRGTAAGRRNYKQRKCDSRCWLTHCQLTAAPELSAPIQLLAPWARAEQWRDGKVPRGPFCLAGQPNCSASATATS